MVMQLLLSDTLLKTDSIIVGGGERSSLGNECSNDDPVMRSFCCPKRTVLLCGMRVGSVT